MHDAQSNQSATNATGNHARRFVARVLVPVVVGLLLLPSAIKLVWYEMLPQTHWVRSSVGKLVIFEMADGRIGTARIEKAEYGVNDCWGWFELRVDLDGEPVAAWPDAIGAYGGGFGPYELWRLRPLCQAPATLTTRRVAWPAPQSTTGGVASPDPVGDGHGR